MDIQKEIDTLQKKIEFLEEVKTIPTTYEKIHCGECGSEPEIKDVPLVICHEYQRPYSCNGGDYYYFSNQYMLECPVCKEMITIWQPSVFTREKYDIYYTSIKDWWQHNVFEFIKNNSEKFKEVLFYYPHGNEKFNIDKVREETQRELRRQNEYREMRESNVYY